MSRLLILCEIIQLKISFSKRCGTMANSPNHRFRGVFDPGEISHAVRFQSGMSLVILPGGPRPSELDALACLPLLVPPVQGFVPRLPPKKIF